MYRLIEGDCLDLELLESLAGQVDAIVTDPPYGIGASTMTLGSGAKEFERGGAWDEERPDLRPLLDLGARHLCVWGGQLLYRRPSSNRPLAHLAQEERRSLLQ